MRVGGELKNLIKPALLGAWRNEPYCVYCKWCIRKDGEFMVMVITRYKGKDWAGEKPSVILRREGG